MPVTDGERVNVFDRRILSALDFDERLLDFLETGQRRHLKAMLTGADPTPDPGVWLTPVTVADGAGLNDLTFGDMYGTGGRGDLISVDAGDSRITDVPFEDAAVTYYMAARSDEVPVGIQVDTETGIVNYDYHRKDLGHKDEPTAVVDGGGFLTLTLGNHALDGADDFTGRTAVVYLKTPEANDAGVAIETVSVVGQTVVTSGVLGQSVPSTTASDYEVVLLGPTITRSASVQSAVRWAFIGTVVGGGAPRVFNTTSQPQVVPQSELSNLFEDLLAKGWLTVPTVSGVGTTITVSTVGQLFTVGRLLDTATQAIPTGSPVNADLFVAYNVIAGEFVLYTSWDTADQGSNVPLWHGTTDGAGLIIDGETIGRRIEKFNETGLLTVSGEPEHRAAFRTLNAALMAAVAIQKGTSPVPQSITIEIVGEVEETVPIGTFQEVFEATDIVIRGARTRIGGATAGGSRITWSFNTAPLFDVGGTSLVRGWRFEGVEFMYTGVAAAALADSCVLYSPASTAWRNVRFRECAFDLPNMAVVGVVDSGEWTGVSFQDCTMNAEDGCLAFLGTALVDRLEVSRCLYDGTATTPIFGTGTTFLADASSVLGSEWLIADNNIATTFKGLEIEHIADSTIRGNRIRCTHVSNTVFAIGDAAGASDVRRLFIHGNTVFADNVAYTGTCFSLDIDSTGSPIDDQDPAEVIIHDNVIRGVNFGGGIGAAMNGTATNGLYGLLFHSNIITGFDEGVRCGWTGDVYNSMLALNMITAGRFPFQCGNAGFFRDIVALNLMAPTTQDGTGIGMIVEGGLDESVIAMNLVDSDFGGTDQGAHFGAGFDSVILGNVINGLGTHVVNTGAAVTCGIRNSTLLGNVQVQSDRWEAQVAHGSNAYTGNVIQSDFLADNSGDTVFTGNFVFGDFNGDGITGSQIVGNNMFRIRNLRSSMVVVGNGMTNDITVHAVSSVLRNVILGNSFGDFEEEGGGAATINNSTFVGNEMNTMSIDPASHHLAIVGNNIDPIAVQTFDIDDSAIVGNVFSDGVTLAAGADQVAAIGNRIEGTLTNSGTNNLVQTATDGDPLNVTGV